MSEATHEPVGAEQSEEAKSATPSLVLRDGEAYHELAADELALFFENTRNGKAFEMEIAIRPPSEERIIRFLKEGEIMYVPSDEERGSIDVERGSFDLEKDLFDEHFAWATLEGKPITAEQLARIDAWSDIKGQFVNRGLADIRVASDDAEERATLDDLLSALTISQHYFLSAGDREVRVDVKHYFREPSAQDGIDFKRSYKFRRIPGRSEKLLMNYDRIRKIYDRLVERVDGMLINGAACTEANKADWLPRVSLFAKRGCVQEIFRASQRKN